MHHPTDRITHTTAFVTPVVEHWLEREIAQWVHPLKDRSDDPSHHERTLTMELHLAPQQLNTVKLKYGKEPFRLRLRKPANMGYSFDLQQGFLMYHPTDRIAHTTYFVIPVVERWMEREIAAREETRFRNYMGYSFSISSKVGFFIYAPFYKQNSTGWNENWVNGFTMRDGSNHRSRTVSRFSRSHISTSNCMLLFYYCCCCCC